MNLLFLFIITCNYTSIIVMSSGYNEVSLISKGLYRIVSDIVGPECIVKLRRQGLDINDDFNNCDTSVEETMVMSGSRGEGFNFESSDFDTMYIDKNAIVLTGSFLLTAPYKNEPTILLMETENVSPGFAFVRCLRLDQNNTTLKNSLLWRGNHAYASSKQIRESFMSRRFMKCHGPCQTNNVFGFDGDHAFTLRSPIWPRQAVPFVRRSLHHGWPSYDTLIDICKDGCLFVPINSKHQQYSDMIDLQWRISFSQAEKKLVYSMNHSQFLCYGLSKLFLNEVLKKLSPNEELLCSYFMKTAVFWEISEDPMACKWSPYNFLSKFWDVFRRLLKWVSLGYCPNFFIPENNMFYGKIFGEKQSTLFNALRELFFDGYWCLLLCPSLYETLSKLIIRPEMAYFLSIDESYYVQLSTIVKEKIEVVFRFDIFVHIINIVEIKRTLTNMLLMLNKSLPENICAVRLGVNRVLHAYSENLFSSRKSQNLPNVRNRYCYNSYKRATYILQRSKTFFCMNDFIFIKHLYLNGNYRKAIEMIHYTRHKLKSKSYMYSWNLDDDIIMKALQEMSYETVVKTSIVSYVKMDEATAVVELIPECIADENTTGAGELYIPPLVFIDFLLILCYKRLGEIQRGHDVLDELHTLLHHDDNRHIKFTQKAISWEILGICQQRFNDRYGAYISYLHALDDEFNYFKQVTIERINSLRN